jgi:prepilin-type N-terminal cleavage/methylation domain-containing protein
MRNRRHQQGLEPSDGFTLVELLLVIIILAILAGIAVIGTSSFRDGASQACSRANDRIAANVSTAQSLDPSGSYPVSGGTC